MRKIIAYLKGTRDLGNSFDWGGRLKLSFHVDVNYADKANDRRSISGVAVMIGKTVVTVSSTT